MKLFLVIDLGTTGMKISLINESGYAIATGYRSYPILAPQSGFAEQGPQEWWNSFLSICQQLNSQHEEKMKDIIAIGICGQMHTHVLLDKNLHVLRPAITWMDQRSHKIIQKITKEPEDAQFIFKKTNNFATTTYTAPQLAWVQENEPHIWSKVEHVLVAKDYLKFLITGKMMTDYSEASGTLLFDVGNCHWSDEMLNYFDIPSSFFPEVNPSDIIMGEVSKEVSELTGIPAGIPVANGSSDNSAAALGAGMVRDGQGTVIIGTAGVVSVCSNQPLVDSFQRTLCWNYCLRNKWITLGILQTAGESLNWFRNAFDNKESEIDKDIFSQYNQSIQDIPDGSDGLIFLPYLNGERTPYWDAYARGVFFGISLFSKKAHFIKAVMEGVSFALRNNLETVESLGIKINELRAVGGGSKSPYWLDILGKILKKPIHTVQMADTGLVGNMLIAGKAIGLYPSIEDKVNEIIQFDREINYSETNEIYEKQYKVFLQIYQQLKDSFKENMN
jgi:xylulokinase